MTIWGVYCPKIFHGRGSVKYLGGLHPQNGGVHQEQAYACPERAYGRLCASHGAGTRRTPPFPNCNTECFKGRGHEYACPEHT